MAFDITSYILGKKSAGGGGSGSSDLTAATVNIIGGHGQNFKIPCIIEDASYSGYVPWTDNETVTVILYKGYCSVYLGDIQGTVSVTGEVEDLGDNEYYITGDCTITIS